jgi:hypothetical protein
MDKEWGFLVRGGWWKLCATKWKMLARFTKESLFKVLVKYLTELQTFLLKTSTEKPTLPTLSRRHTSYPIMSSKDTNTPAMPQAEQGESASEKAVALSILQTVEGQQFNSLAEAATHIRTLDPPARRQCVSMQAESLIKVGEKVDSYLAYLQTFVEKDDAFKDRKAQDPEVWAKVEEGAQRAKTRMNKKDEAKKKVIEKWGEAEVNRHFGHLMEAGDTTWSKVRRMAMKTDLDTAVVQLRSAAFHRVTNPKRGRDSTTLEPVAADFNMVHEGQQPAASASDITAAGYAVSEVGWLIPVERVLQIEDVDTDDAAVESEDPMEEEERGGQRGAEANRNPGLRLTRGKSAETKPDKSDESANASTPLSDSSDLEATPDPVTRDDTEDDDYESEPTLLAEKPTTKRKRGEEDSHGCGCDAGIPNAFIAKCKTNKALNPAGQISLIKRWAELREEGKDTCFQHTKNIASLLGFQTRALTSEVAKARLLRYHNAVEENKTGDLKQGKDTYKWFRQGSRPERPSDRLGPYKLQPVESGAFNITSEVQLDLRRFFKIDDKAWDEQGSVVIDCCQWWNTVGYSGENASLNGKTIMEVVLEEYDMYDAHLRKINDKPNYGWLRNMYYSLGQQVMRQDPAYYGIYCALRPDMNTDLVSYPYYAKYTHPGDSTFFRHIDINIKDLAKTGRGSNMIQGTLSIDDEASDDCTMILPGMHKNIVEWEKILESRGLSTKAMVHRIKDSMFTEEDEKKFGTKWTPQPCQSGQVRVTLPHLPHGAYGPAKNVRRTMLPWYCGLQRDLETLEVVESGTWSDLSRAHRDLVAAPLSPSGLPNRYGAIPFAFPAAVELEGLGAISDAMVCRRRHDKVAVVMEKRLLLKGTDHQRETYLQQWRAKAVNAVCDAFEIVKQAEIEKFGMKSYFTRKAGGLSPAVSDDDPDPSPDTDTAAHGFEEPEADEDTKEGDEMEISEE